MLHLAALLVLSQVVTPVSGSTVLQGQGQSLDGGSADGGVLRPWRVFISGGSLACTGPLTDTQLRATPVPVSGSLTCAVSNPAPIFDGGVALTAPIPTGSNTIGAVTQAGQWVAAGRNNAGTATDLKVSDAGAAYTMGSAVAPLVAVELCAAITAGGTAVTLNAATTRFTIENDGPNPVTCTFNGAAPVAHTAGLTLLAKSTSTIDRWPIPVVGPTTVTCIADTALQVTGACVNLIPLQ